MRHNEFIKKIKRLSFMLKLKTMLPKSKHALESMLKLIDNPNEKHKRLKKLNELINNSFIISKDGILYASSVMNNYIEISAKALHNYISKDRKRLLDKLKKEKTKD